MELVAARRQPWNSTAVERLTGKLRGFTTQAAKQPSCRRLGTAKLEPRGVGSAFAKMLRTEDGSFFTVAAAKPMCGSAASVRHFSTPTLCGSARNVLKDPT